MKICIYNTLKTHFKNSFNIPFETPVHNSVLIAYLKFIKKSTYVVGIRLKTRWIRRKTCINHLDTYVIENQISGCCQKSFFTYPWNADVSLGPPPPGKNLSYYSKRCTLLLPTVSLRILSSGIHSINIYLASYPLPGKVGITIWQSILNEMILSCFNIQCYFLLASINSLEVINYIYRFPDNESYLKS